MEKISGAGARDLPGQLANRVFQAIIRESIAIVASGLATAEDVDTAISCGMAMRFPEWGPLKHLDAIGWIWDFPYRKRCFRT